MKLLNLIRNNYDKILHFSVSMNIAFIGSILNIHYLILLVAVLLIGTTWEMINWTVHETKPSWADMTANMIGVTVGILISH